MVADQVHEGLIVEARNEAQNIEEVNARAE
jgi:hypothetical protein